MSLKVEGGMVGQSWWMDMVNECVRLQGMEDDEGREPKRNQVDWMNHV